MRRSVPQALLRPGLPLTAVAGLVLALGMAAAPAATARPAAPRSCAVPAAGLASCHVVKASGGPAGLSPRLSPSGYAHADFDAMYKLPANGGAGATVAVVDAQDDPNAAADLAVYRAQYGLSACTVTSGCFRKVGQTGSPTVLPTPDAGWAEEESLGIDMASAVAPAAHILLVEANSASMANLGAAVNEAVALGATSVEIGWGTTESTSDSTYDNSYFNHPGVAISAASDGVEYPAASKNVTAVGVTAVTPAPGSKRGYTETAAGSGGCSTVDTKPTWQHDAFCAKRSVADVAAVGDPATGVAVYDTYGGDPGWEVFGGSSVSAGIIAGVFADAGVASAGSHPASFPYAHPTGLFDITTGTGAGVGYDLPTGLGSPNGVTAFSG